MTRIGMRAGRACAVELADGSSLEARVIVSGADAWRTLQVLGRDNAPAELARGIDSLDFRSPVMKLNLALGSLPVFPNCPDAREPGPWHQGTIHLGAATMAELDASFAAAERGELPERPMIELMLPSALDPTLAPSGQYVASLFVQHVPPSAPPGKHKTVHTRFAPEPNGYLHIGHAKSICLNFGLAIDYNGKCNLRFDDTNPTKEEQEYVDSIKGDVKWLGFDWEDREYYASDYFGQLYDFAVTLIKAGKAYVCDLTADEIRAHRGTLTEPGTESPIETGAWRKTYPSSNA